MLRHECPGPDRKARSVPEEVECPECGTVIEMWSDDAKVTCPSCSKQVTRDQLSGKK